MKGIRFQTPDDLLLSFAGTSAYVPWTSQRTIFRDAAQSGRRTAIIGSVHPYCRLFGTDAARCEAVSEPQAADLMKWWSTVQAEPLHRAMLLQVSRLLPMPSVRRFDGARFSRWTQAMPRHVEERMEASVARTRALLLDSLTDPTIDFIYAHLPLPHPPELQFLPGTTNRLPERSYVGNLIAADHLLGEIIQAMISSGKWEQGSIVLTSDHSVRSFWKYMLLLSPSLLRAIEERTEPTVPLLVKLPRQTQPRVYSKPFNAVLVHGVVQALLAGEMSRPDDLAEYISNNAGHEANARAQ